MHGVPAWKTVPPGAADDLFRGEPLDPKGAVEVPAETIYRQRDSSHAQGAGNNDKPSPPGSGSGRQQGHPTARALCRLVCGRVSALEEGLRPLDELQEPTQKACRNRAVHDLVIGRKADGH